MRRVAHGPALFRLSLVVAAGAAVAAGVGIASDGGAPPPAPFVTARAETVLLDGRGIYRHDSRFIAAGFRGQDWVTLAVGIPLLVTAAIRHERRPSARRAAPLLGVLAFFLYGYASMALAAAYNPLFLVYVALFSASFFGVVLAFGSVNRGCAHLGRPGVPRRLPGTFLLASGCLTAVVWLAPLVGALLDGRPPKLLDHYTTMVTYALDLAIVTPAALWSGVLVLRRRPTGYVIATALLGIIILLAPVIAAGTLSQRAAGIAFTPGEAAGPIAGFVILGALGLRVFATISRHLPDEASPAGPPSSWPSPSPPPAA